MSDAGKVHGQSIPNHGAGSYNTDAAVAVALGLAAVLVGLGATLAGAWIAYWHGAALVSVGAMLAAPEPDAVSLYLVICGTVTTILGGLSIFRAQDM